MDGRLWNDETFNLRVCRANRFLVDSCNPFITSISPELQPYPALPLRGNLVHMCQMYPILPAFSKRCVTVLATTVQPKCDKTSFEFRTLRCFHALRKDTQSDKTDMVGNSGSRSETCGRCWYNCHQNRGYESSCRRDTAQRLCRRSSVEPEPTE
jgi:hypothetical protein